MKDNIKELIDSIDRYLDLNRQDSQFAIGGHMVASLVKHKLLGIYENN